MYQTRKRRRKKLSNISISNLQAKMGQMWRLCSRQRWADRKAHSWRQHGGEIALK